MMSTNCQLVVELLTSIQYKLACAPINDSDQTVHLHSLIRVFDGCSVGRLGTNVSSCGRLKTEQILQMCRLI